MHETSLIESFLYFLLASAIAVPLFRRLGLGAILGYLVAGIVIGPQGLSLIHDPAEVLHFSELGVILLLFLIGLELNPASLWSMRKHIALLGGGQLLLSAAALTALAILVFAIPRSPAIVVALALALSSTAFAIQLMAEKGIMGTQNGRRGFSILLMQDLAVIPILFIVQALAGVSDDSFSWGISIGALVLLVVSGRYLINPLLKLIAKHGGREAMTAAALAVVLGAAVLMELVHLSMSLGAFLAGILLANSSFRHQLETDIEPFKALTLGIFFIAIGMTMNVQLFLSQPLLLIGLAIGLMLVKSVIIAMLFRLSGIAWRQNLPIAFMLCQGGEFGFVIMSQGQSLQLLDPQLSAMINLVIGLSMAMTSPVVQIISRIMERSADAPNREFDDIQNTEPEVLILGFGRFGQITGRILSANHIPFTALDKEPEHIDFVKRFGNKIYYGDARRMDLLEQAGAGTARVIMIAIDQPDCALELVNIVKEQFPQVKLVVRARNRMNFLQLKAAGADVVIREVFAASLQAAQETLVGLGMNTTNARRLTRLFDQHDSEMLQRAAEHHGDMDALIEMNKQGRQELARLFAEDLDDTPEKKTSKENI